MAETSFDIIVVGGGPGGYVTAIRAAQLGLKTACVEREHLGGICLNWGCIPTKALLRSAEIGHLLQHADAYGFSASNVTFDLKKVVDRSRKVANQLSAGVKHLLKKNKVEVFDGHGRLNGPGKLKVEKDGKPVADLAAKNIILATGARARALPGLEPDGKLVWTYKEAMVPPTMPKSLLVVGSGAIGIEFASFYRTLGAEVTVVEVLDRVLPVEDAEISAFAKKAFEKQGMKIMTSATVKALKKGADNVTATVEAGGKSQDITVDRVILAIGIVGNVENLGLEGTKVKVEKSPRGGRRLWRHRRAGRLCHRRPGRPALAGAQGQPRGRDLRREDRRRERRPSAGMSSNIPGCTYCMPQVASVGLTEQAAKDKGYDVKVGKFPFIGNGKAIALGEPEGLVKTVFDAKTGELLGAHMIGAEVTELIQGYTIAKTMETTEAELMHTIFPHPTLSEMMHESVLAAYGRVIHM